MDLKRVVVHFKCISAHQALFHIVEACGKESVLQALNEIGLLEPENLPPTLIGKPVMLVEPPIVLGKFNDYFKE